MSSLSFLNRPILSFRNLTILALLASAMLLVATHSGGARSVPVASADHGVGYIFIPGPSLTWADADAFALVNFGGNLASIHSPAENSQVLSAIQGSDSWIGLNDIASPFDFEWSDGSPVDYTNFALGEPNGDGDCLYITSAGEWADSDCAVARPFVVQRPAATLTVTNLNDDGSGGTLREAIGNAQPGDIIDFAVTGTITLTSGELSINKDLTINGPGTGSLTIDGNASSRIFTIGSSATVSISGLTFKNGIGDLGGAIGINSPSTLTLSNSTVSGNEASGGDGGGIFNSGAVTLINSTVSGNSSQLGRGGGIFNSGAVNFRNTIIAGNSSSSKGPDCFGTLTSQGFNLVENVAGCTITGSEDTIIGDASLDVLADNGGPTETHALLAGSSAIDAGDPASTLTIDQRGVSRPQGPRIDIGAFELLVPTDADSDGFFSLATGGTDCNDDDINVNPGATEILNGIDDDCDGDIDAADPSLAADDLDNDGFFSLATGGTDCNDNNPNVNPNATEVLNSIDDDCDGLVDGDDPDLIPATATTITVTTTNDLGAGSLRQAINDALPGDRIDFDSSILPGTIGLTSGELSIDKDLTINGPGAGSLTIDGNASSPIFTIGSSATASISGLTIKNGTSDHDGGGIFNSGTLTLSSSTVSGNSLTFGDGGGIFNSGMLTLINSTVSGNTADSQDGGGIYNTSAGTVTLINSTVSDNTAGSDGGGIGNAFDGTVILTNSTVSGNSAGSDGGGIFNDEFSTLTLNNSTVTGNSAGLGGGIYNSVGGTVSFRNTIIAGNSASFGNGPDCFDILTSQGFNLVQDEAGCTIAGETADNITGQDPLLDVLADNGGPTLTHALRARSPAIDAGNSATPGSEGTACESTDQRGIARPQGDACDIGAFELLVLADVNDAPVITSNGGGATAAVNTAENQTAVTVVTATDADLPAQTLTFSITGGADQALFGIVAGTGVLTFNSAPDFENPADAGANNVYDVQVTVTDNGAPNLSDVQDIAVTVTTSADLVLSISPSAPIVVAAGNQGSVTLDVQAAANSGTQTLSSYQLFVDLSPPPPAGRGIPAGWSVTTPVQVVSLSDGALFSGSTSPTQGDVSANGRDDFSIGVTLDTTPTTLWRFTVDMDGTSGAEDGIFPVSFLTGGDFNVSSQDFNAINFTTIPASITLEGFGSTIIIIKDTVPDAAQNFSFTDDIAAPNAFTLDDDADSTLPNTQTFTNVAPGTFTVTEAAVAGYSTTVSCVDPDGDSTAAGTNVATIDLAAGETVTCTFTNTQLGTINIIKDTVPDAAQDFSFTDDIAAPNAFTLDDDADGTLPNTQTFINVAPGGYEVTEAAVAGYSTTVSCVDPDGGSTAAGTNVATISLAAGETVTCTFTNTQLGTINIIKDTVPDAAQDFSFTDDIAAPNAFTLDDDADGTLPNTQTFINVAPGGYEVTEAAVAGYSTTVSCVDPDGGSTAAGTNVATISLAAGETVTCTFTNTQLGTTNINDALDNLNAEVSSRASQVTVEAIEGKLDALDLSPLDNLDATVSSRATPLDVTSARDAVIANTDAARDAITANANARADALDLAVEAIEGKLDALDLSPLDNLDATVSSRATPLDVTSARDAVIANTDAARDAITANTNARADTLDLAVQAIEGKLDALDLSNLDVAVSSRATPLDVTAASDAVIANTDTARDAINLNTNTRADALDLAVQAIEGKLDALDLSNLDVAVSSRATPLDVTAASDAVIANTDAARDAINLNTNTRADAIDLAVEAIEGKLDALDLSNLDVAVSSRATPADVTAASDAVIANTAASGAGVIGNTNARADNIDGALLVIEGKLDAQDLSPLGNLDATISSRADQVSIENLTALVADLQQRVSEPQVERVRIDLNTVKKRERYLLFTDVAGQPVDTNLVSVEAADVKKKEPFLFTGITQSASATQTGTGVLNVELDQNGPDKKLIKSADIIRLIVSRVTTDDSGNSITQFGVVVVKHDGGGDNDGDSDG